MISEQIQASDPNTAKSQVIGGKSSKPDVHLVRGPSKPDFSVNQPQIGTKNPSDRDFQLKCDNYVYLNILEYIHQYVIIIQTYKYHQRNMIMGYNDGRKQLRRLLELVRTLENTSHGMQVAVLARLYDVDQTRIYNDLKIITEFYNLEKKNGFYRIKNERPPITQKELNALTAAVNAFSHSNGNPFEKQLRKALQKLHRPVANYIQNQMDQDTDISIQLKTGGHCEKLDEYFQVFEKALYEKKAVRATYKSAGKTEPVQHLLHPYAIFFRKEDWYLEAHSDQREETSRTFKIIRFQKVELTDKHYEAPLEFSLSKNLESRWELFSGDPVKVEVKIAAHKAYLVEEKMYHPSQEIIDQLEDGSVVVSYYVPKEEFTFWVLSLGDAAEVLTPPEFRAEFQEIVQRMCDTYLGN